MIDSTTYQQWRKSTFYALKQQFSNANDSMLEDAISVAYFQMWEDSIADEPKLSITLNTLKYLSKCRTIDELRKYRLEISTADLPECRHPAFYDDSKDDLIQKAIEMKVHLNPREQFLMEEKFKIKDYSNMSNDEIQDFRTQKYSDETIMTVQNYPSMGAVRADRKRGLKKLLSFF